MSHLEQAAHDLTETWSGCDWFQAVGVDEKNNQLFIYCKKPAPKRVREKQFRTIPLVWEVVGQIRFL